MLLHIPLLMSFKKRNATTTLRLPVRLRLPKAS